MQIGDTMYAAWATVGYGGAGSSSVAPVKVMGIVDGVAVIEKFGTVRTVDSFERLFDTEAEAWQHCAAELARFREHLDRSLAEATAKAAACRVGEAVPA